MNQRFLMMTIFSLAFSCITAEPAHAANKRRRLWNPEAERQISLGGASEALSRRAPQSPRRRPVSPLNPRFTSSDLISADLGDRAFMTLRVVRDEIFCSVRLVRLMKEYGTLLFGVWLLIPLSQLVVPGERDLG